MDRIVNKKKSLSNGIDRPINKKYILLSPIYIILDRLYFINRKLRGQGLPSCPVLLFRRCLLW